MSENRREVNSELINDIVTLIINAEGSGVAEDASHPSETRRAPDAANADVHTLLLCDDGENAILQSYVSLMRQYLRLVEMCEVQT